MFTEEIGVDREWKTQNCRHDYVLHRVEARLEWLEASEPLREISHPCRDAPLHEQGGNRRAIREAPQLEPIAALKISIALRLFVAWYPVQVNARFLFDVEGRLFRGSATRVDD